MEARALMGDDYWSYGVPANRHVLETFFRHHHAQGLSSTPGDAGGSVPSGDAGERRRYDAPLSRQAAQKIAIRTA